MDTVKRQYSDTMKENLGLAVYNVGFQQCDPGHAWGPAVRAHYLIHLVTSGRGVFRFNGKVYSLQKGDLFLALAGRVVAYQADYQDPWEYYWVGFQGADAKRMLQLAGLNEANPVIRVPEESHARDRLLQIYEARGNTPAADATMVGYLYLLLGSLIRESAGEPAYGAQQYLEQAMRFIQYNYADNITVADMARYADVSRSQLYRAFMEQCGLSPHAYLQKFRINTACGLLRSRRYTISEVAGSVGFNDPLYFSRIFQRLKGVSPTAYQRAAGKEGREEARKEIREETREEARKE